jgi:hypothetical protein
MGTESYRSINSFLDGQVEIRRLESSETDLEDVDEVREKPKKKVRVHTIKEHLQAFEGGDDSR